MAEDFEVEALHGLRLEEDLDVEALQGLEEDFDVEPLALTLAEDLARDLDLNTDVTTSVEELRKMLGPIDNFEESLKELNEELDDLLQELSDYEGNDDDYDSDDLSRQDKDRDLSGAAVTVRCRINEKKEEIKELQSKKYAFHIAVDSILDRFKNPDEPNKKAPFFHDVPTSRAFEFFAAAFIVLTEHCLLSSITVDVTGGANDIGVDGILKKDEEKKAVIQVKCGKFFEKGKGNSIVLQLAGSCLFHGVHRGIIVSNESIGQLKQSTRNIIHTLSSQQAKYEIKIETFFLNNIVAAIKDETDFKTIVEMFEDFKERMV